MNGHPDAAEHGARLKPHHPTAELAETEAQRAADLTGRPFVVWFARALAGASSCWTVTEAGHTFPRCCSMRMERTVHPHPLWRIRR